MAWCLRETVDPRAPVDEILDTLRCLAYVNLDEALIIRVVTLDDHVLEEGLFTVTLVSR